MNRATIKRLARYYVSTFAYYGGYLLLAMAAGRHYGARIMAYHSITDQPANVFAVSTQDFDQQMRYLADNFNVIGMDDLFKLLQNSEPIPPWTITITLDDGYVDNYTNAYPILKHYRLPATLFVSTDYIGTDHIPESAVSLRYLTWDQVREMSGNGISFGSHTRNHKSLTILSHNEIKDQLEHSKATLESKIGKPITGFSYPYGTIRDFNEEIQQLVAQAGYSWAVAGIIGINTSKTDPYALRRTKVERDDRMYVFTKSVRGAMDPWVLVDQYGSFIQARHR